MSKIKEVEYYGVHDRYYPMLAVVVYFAENEYSSHLVLKFFSQAAVQFFCTQWSASLSLQTLQEGVQKWAEILALPAEDRLGDDHVGGMMVDTRHNAPRLLQLGAVEKLDEHYLGGDDGVLRVRGRNKKQVTAYLRHVLESRLQEIIPVAMSGHPVSLPLQFVIPNSLNPGTVRHLVLDLAEDMTIELAREHPSETPARVDWTLSGWTERTDLGIRGFTIYFEVDKGDDPDDDCPF